MGCFGMVVLWVIGASMCGRGASDPTPPTPAAIETQSFAGTAPAPTYSEPSYATNEPVAASSATTTAPAPTYTREPEPQSTWSEPAETSAPAGASAQCMDGTYSFSANRRGTCSHHGGVSRWL